MLIGLTNLISSSTGSDPPIISASVFILNPIDHDLRFTLKPTQPLPKSKVPPHIDSIGLNTLANWGPAFTDCYLRKDTIKGSHWKIIPCKLVEIDLLKNFLAVRHLRIAVDCITRLSPIEALPGTCNIRELW